MRYFLLVSILIIAFRVHAQSDFYDLELLQSETDASFRGMSLADDGSLWLAGAKGVVVQRFHNKTSVFKVMAEGAPDLRSIWAFDNQTAVAVGIGSPCLIFRTSDGGQNWQVVFSDLRPEMFLDGIAFWDKKRGLVYGDPIAGKMTILQTKDGGSTWVSLPEKSLPVLEVGEASFAASGTGIQCMAKKRVMIATGGTKSRLWISNSRGKSWKSVEVPILQGKESQGIFSFDFADKKNAVVVGGDYLQDSFAERHVYLTADGGETWEFPEVPTRGYRECVRYLDPYTLMACGPSGLDISTDGGRTWEPFSDERGFHVLKFFALGKKGFVAGAGGRMAEIMAK